jgi:2-oxoglutarate ferredoxin oxidoreductase subunit beta
MGSGYTESDLWIHDEGDLNKAQILARLFDQPGNENYMPRPFGVLYATTRPCYEEQLQQQIQFAIGKNGMGDLDALIAGHETWTVL